MDDNNQALPGSLQRIRDLATVGRALTQRSSSAEFETEYYLAQQALTAFQNSINALGLDPETLKGISDLTAYLRKKVDKRLESSVKGGTLDSPSEGAGLG